MTALYIAGLTGSGVSGYFTDQHGGPRILAHEQAWALPWNAGRWNGGNWQSDMDAYFSTRASQGYTAWYGVAWQSQAVDTTGPDQGRTWDGIYPFLVNGTAGAITSSGQTVTLNNSFWARIDYMFGSALTNGITCFLNAPGLYYDYQTGGLFQDAGNTQLAAIGTGLATRYPQSSYPNVFWFFGDDQFGNTADNGFMNAMLSAMQTAGDTRVPISEEMRWEGNTHIEFDTGAVIDPGGFGPTSCTYNWVYTYAPVYNGIEQSYTETGTTLIPVVWGDGTWYGDTDNSTPDYTIRRFTWWALASGARGFNNTCGPSAGGVVWQWQSGAAAALTTDPNGPWITSHHGPVVSYFTGLTDWHKLIPDTGNVFVTAGRGTRAGAEPYDGGAKNYGDTDDYAAASITPAGSLAVIYSAAHFSITINQSKMQAGYTATWVDPLTTATTSAATGSTYNSASLGNNSAGDPDWALVLQAPVAAPAATTTVYQMRRFP